jgi:hypothetical protein
MRYNEDSGLFRFKEADFSQTPLLTIADTFTRRPFFASRGKGITVFTKESMEICGYAGIDRGFYLSTCALLGLVQWRALALNELLESEDFLTREESNDCLYSARSFIQEYALAFEHPCVCGACLSFYRCLGAETEILTLRELLSRANREKHVTRP